MNDNNTEMINMPNGEVISFDECIDNLCHTRDIEVYLNSVLALRDRYLIILSVKDTPGEIYDGLLEKIRKIGFKGFKSVPFQMYAGAVYKGEIICDKCGEAAYEPVSFEGQVEKRKFSIVSKALKKGNVSQIIIEETDYSINGRGLNFVVYDCEKVCVVDSVGYDSCYPNPELYHRNFLFDENYFKKHFYIDDAYIKPWREAFKKKYMSNQKLNVDEVINGIIEPLKTIAGIDRGGVCDENFNFICGHANYPQSSTDILRCITKCYPVEAEEIQYSSETVLFGGIIFDHPGHLILESIAERLWWIANNPESKIKIAIVVKWHRNADYFRQFLELMDIPDERLIIVKKPTKFAKIIVPDACEMMYNDTVPYYFTREYPNFFVYLKNKIKPSCHKKIFLSKSKTAKGNVLGENIFVEFYRKKGFEIIYPEDYTIKEKAEIMLGADEVVSTAGTNMLFTVFCKYNAKVTMLTRTNNMPYFSMLTITIDKFIDPKNFYIVDTDIGFMHKDFVWGISLMGITNEFINYVRDTYNEEIEISPKDSLKESLYDYLSYFPEYYSVPRHFITIKNQSMASVLQMISRVFKNKDFDTSQLDLTPKEYYLRGEINKLSANLEQSNKRVSELEQTDTNKARIAVENAAGYLENTNSELVLTNARLEKQIAVLRDALEKMPDMQSTIDELTKENAKLTESAITSKHTLELRERDFKLNEEMLRNKMNASEDANNELSQQLEELKSRLSRENSELANSIKALEAAEHESKQREEQLQKQIGDFEQSISWKITKPFRSIARLFRKK